MAYYTWNK